MTIGANKLWPALLDIFISQVCSDSVRGRYQGMPQQQASLSMRGAPLATSDAAWPVQDYKLACRSSRHPYQRHGQA